MDAAIPPVRAGRERAADGPATLEAAIEAACRRIAPLWPLDGFVAVNPFLGLADLPFVEAVERVARISGGRLLPPRRVWREIAAGADDASAARADRAVDPSGIASPEPALPPRIALVSDLATRLEAMPERLVADMIAAWCAAYHDAGEARWPMPWRDRGLYAAWRAAARHDRRIELAGMAGFRAALAALPATAEAAIAAACARLGVDAAVAETVMHRALADLPGWAGYIRHLDWTDALAGRPGRRLRELLAVRLAAEAALFACVTPRTQAAWRAECAALGQPATPADRRLDLALLEAAEERFQRRVAAALRAGSGPAERPAAQAVFCIDVRSEVFRRALEAVAPGVETLGFAGFFGFAAEVVPFGRRSGAAHCPVLLRPSFTVCETLSGASAAEEAAALGRLRLRQRMRAAWESFRAAAVACFPFVESVGLAYGAKLLRDGFALAPPAPAGAAQGVDAGLRARLAPALQPRDAGGRPVGLALPARIEAAAAALRAMSLESGFAPLVLLVGHGSTTANNPHAAGLDCGACGGRTGAASARIAAAALNDPEVREGLAGRGIRVPGDTWFVAALHDTTTDDVRLFDEARVPAGHAEALARLKAALAEAGRRARAERARALGIARARDLDRAIRRRARDWAEVRPEWGLAGNAAFIAAPRARTRGADLGGRVFLHSYDHGRDPDHGVLELILTAPVIVASWINLQYYASAIDNAVFGAGDKVLHNVVAQRGVLVGNAGDLQVGLPWQSVHDGARLAHEPLRLSVFVEAPIAAIGAIVARHEGLASLLDNGWMHLFALAGDGSVAARYRGRGAWEERPFG